MTCATVSQGLVGLVADGGEGESLHPTGAFYGGGLEDIFDDLLLGGLGAAFGGEDEAVAQGGDGDGLDVVGEGEVSSFQKGVGLGEGDEAEGRAGGRAEVDGGAVSGGVDEVNDVVGDEAVNEDVSDGLLGEGHFFEGYGLGEAFDGVGGHLAFDDVGFFLYSGVAEAETKDEAVEFGFGKGEGAAVFGGVAGG